MIVELPYPPRGLHPNDRQTWRAKMRHRKAYRAAAGEWAALARIEHKLKPLASASLRLCYFHPRNKMHDPDNLIAWAKTAIDALQDARILADDRDVIYLPPVQAVDRDRPRLEVEISTGDLG